MTTNQQEGCAPWRRALQSSSWPATVSYEERAQRLYAPKELIRFDGAAGRRPNEILSNPLTARRGPDLPYSVLAG